jgi:hypothetical protein
MIETRNIELLVKAEVMRSGWNLDTFWKVNMELETMCLVNAHGALDSEAKKENLAQFKASEV